MKHINIVVNVAGSSWKTQPAFLHQQTPLTIRSGRFMKITFGQMPPAAILNEVGIPECCFGRSYYYPVRGSTTLIVVCVSPWAAPGLYGIFRI